MRPAYEVKVIPTGDPAASIVEDETGEEALLARIPMLTGSANKVRYLSYRAMGFTVREAAKLSDVRQAAVVRWRKLDPEFAEIEQRYIRDLQRNLAGDLLRMEFMRNMRLALHRDSQVLFKAAMALDELTEREYDYLKNIRKHYTPAEMLALDRATAPEYDQNTASVTASITVQLGKEEVEDEVSRRAAARSLLDKFRVNATVVQKAEPGHKTIVGETVEGFGEGSTDHDITGQARLLE